MQKANVLKSKRGPRLKAKQLQSKSKAIAKQLQSNCKRFAFHVLQKANPKSKPKLPGLQRAVGPVSLTLRIQCRQCSSRLSDSCMADLLRASIPERGAASTLQELLLRSQPLPRSPLRQYSSSSCSEAAAMAAADSLLTPLESCKNGVHSSWHQVVRQRQVSSGQHGHHRLWCGQPPSGAASAASRRPLPRGKPYVWARRRLDILRQGDSPE